jgi:hypothetical protein
MVVWLVVLPAGLGSRYAVAELLPAYMMLGIDVGLFVLSRVAYRDLRPADPTMYNQRHNAGDTINAYSCLTAFLVMAGCLQILGVWRP